MTTTPITNVQSDNRWPAVFQTTKSVLDTNRYGTTDAHTWCDRVSDVYNLTAKFSPWYQMQIYAEVKQLLEEHCQLIFQEIAESEHSLLNTYSKRWSEYSTGATLLNALYQPLNTLLVKKRPVTENENYDLWDYLESLDDVIPMEIGELALETWVKVIIQPMKDRLVKLLLEQIHLDRVSESVNQSMVKDVIMSLVNVYQYRRVNQLKLYDKLFEGALLAATEDYYQKESKLQLAALHAVQYMRKAVSLLDAERLRIRRFLNDSSYDKMEKICVQCLVGDHCATIIAECSNLFESENLEALRDMYRLLEPIANGVDPIINGLRENILHVGKEKVSLLKEENLSTSFVETVLQLHTKYARIIRDIFASNAGCIAALDKACATVMNAKNENHSSAEPAEFVAQYCDGLLRNAVKTLSDSEMEAKLVDAATVFNYLDNKDRFHQFYQKLLARRLIHRQLTSMDAEEFMISKMRDMCGHDFTSRLTRMFQDAKTSDELNGAFLTHIRSQTQSTSQDEPMSKLVGFDFHVHVLQVTCWPFAQPTNNTFAIPAILERPMHSFESFHKTQRSNRKLLWIYNVSTGDVRLSHLDRPYLVTMSTYQMAILLLFNDHQQLTLNEIEGQTKIHMKELEKQLAILIENKLLLCDTKLLTSHSIVSVNTDFTSKRTKFKIQSTTPKDVKRENELAERTIEEDRKFYLQAATVRIMKARKTLALNSLIEEICTYSKGRFTPEIPLIKKCIEVLVEKQYLERNASDEYQYIN